MLSNTDGLTGIANRRRFDEVLTNEWQRAARSRQSLALVMIDVDLFKNYNDHYGHQLGDDCLRKIAEMLLASSRRASDLAARYGGEEFVLIAVDTDIESARHLAEVDLDAQVQALPFYRKRGFVEEGEEFMDAGIPHRKMRLKLKKAGKREERREKGKPRRISP